MSGRRALSRGRAVDRLVNFSDAVVAVAITLMVLPLVDLHPEPGTGIMGVISSHGAQLTTFLFTFFVVSVMWAAHNRILNRIAAYDVAVFWLNMAWLAGIVLLPLATSLPHTVTPSAGAWSVYWLLLALVSLIGGLLGRHIDRHPDLGGVREAAGRSGRLRSTGFTVFFLALAVVSLWSADVASYLSLGLIPLSIWLRPAREDSSIPGTEPTGAASPKET